LSDPVSWFLIEPGWAVVARDGTEVGAVERVLGDEGHDIFDGLVVTSGVLGRARSVRAERIAEITEGRIRLDLAPDDAKELPEYQAGAGSIPPAP
jgi:hypothetical protein